jgi:hypothetical protein
MTDSEILAELERRIDSHPQPAGWSEEHAGFWKVQKWLQELRRKDERVHHAGR